MSSQARIARCASREADSTVCFDGAESLAAAAAAPERPAADCAEAGGATDADTIAVMRAAKKPIDKERDESLKQLSPLPAHR